MVNYSHNNRLNHLEETTLKKRIIALVLAVILTVLTLGLAACANTDSPDTKTTAAAVAPDAGSDLAYVQNKGTLVVGITDYAPMDYKEKGSDEWTGFDAEFARAVAAKLGVTAEFVEIDWDNKFFELDSKSIDCIWNGMTITDEALASSSVSDPYVKNAQVVVMSKDALAQYTTVESLSELSFAAEAGSAGEKAVNAAGLDCVSVSTQANALMEVSSGSADACVIDITMANAMTGEGTSYASLGYSLELTTEEYGIAFREGSDLTAKVNALMAELTADGTLPELAEKYELTLA